MRVFVKRIDIERGQPNSIFLCPIARAVRRALRKAGRYPKCVAVDARRCSAVYGRRTYTRALGPRAAAFVRDFDQGRFARPFSFSVAGL